MDKTYDVVVVGELNVDIILNEIETLPEIGKETLARQMTITLGSSSAIFATNLRTLGPAVTFVGKLGRDNFGDYIISFFQERGVDTENIQRTSYSTGATVVLNFREDRAMVTYPGAISHLSVNDIPGEVLGNARHLHVSSVFLQSGLKPDILDLYKRAKKSGLTTSLDPQWDPEEKWDMDFHALLPYVDIFMPNIQELQNITGKQDMHKAIESIKPVVNTLVVKHGNMGAYLWDGKTLLHQPAFLNKDVVDCIGAGDSFDAGFIYKFLQEKPLKDCLEFAALAGAISTTRAGGTMAFKDYALVKSIAESSFNYTL